MTEVKTSPSLGDLIAAAERARAAYDWETALTHAGQALIRKGIPPDTALALLAVQAEAHQGLGDLGAEEADLAAMVRLAEEMGDPERQVEVMLRQVDLYLRLGRVAESKDLSRAAAQTARERGALGLEAAGLVALSRAFQVESRFSEAREMAEQALARFRSIGDPLGEARALLWLSIANSRQERVVEAAAQAQAALELFRREGDREGEARSLNTLGIRSSDIAQRRSYYQQALAAYEAVGDRRGQAQVHNNLAITSQQVGLYALSAADASEAVEVVRAMGARVDLAYYLDTLARAWLGLGDAGRAEALFQEGLAVCREVGDASVEAFYIFGLGRAAHAAGQLIQAAELYRTAADRFGSLDIPAEQATCLGWLGAAALELGDVDGARTHTAQAVSLLERAAGAAQEYPPQEIWWYRYQALAASPVSSPSQAGEEDRGDEAWLALDRAREVMLAGIANLSDGGLRRNYLNKVPANRQIIGEWLRQATRRGVPPAALTAGLSGPGRGQEQLRRMLDISLRLNTYRGAGGLARFVVDQAVELTGAEHTVLYHCADQAGLRAVAAEFSMGPAHASHEIDSLLDMVSLKRQAILRHVPPGTRELEQISQLCVPLLASGKLVALLYASVAGTFGLFTDRDRDLLTLLANQAAVALENAAWAQTLEQRVDERTAALQAANRGLEQRTAELEAINSVQQALAAQLDLQAIFAVIGDKIRDIFAAQAVFIFTYDQATRLTSMRYAVEKGQRLADEEPFPFSRNVDNLIRTRRPVLIDENTEQHMAELGMRVVPGTLPPQSMLFVPVIAGNQVIGSISLQDLEREHAFTEPDVRLLTTLAASMSVALESARLFDETNRLLTETQQRSRELEVMNRVQQGLAASLDMQAKYDLVGDEIRHLFDAQALLINTYDPTTGQQHLRYHFESGQRFYEGPTPISAIGEHLIRTRQVLLINKDVEHQWTELGLQLTPGTEMPRSMLYVPLLAAGEVRGSISLQNLDRENAFSDSDVRLLTTLANSMSVALENARLFDETNRLLEETRQRAAELATVNRISQAAASELALEALIQAVGEQVRHTFGADLAYVALLDAQAGTIHFPYSFGEDTPPMRLGTGVTSWIIQTGQPLLINSDYRGRSAELGVVPVGVVPQSYLGVPISLGGEAIGVISVQSTSQQGRFDEDDLRLLSTIAANVGGALHNAQLYQETERRAFQMATIAEIGREVSATLELDAILASVAGHVHSLFQAQDTVLRLLQADGQTFRTVVSLGRYAEEFRSDVFTFGDGIAGHIAESGVAELIEDPAKDPRRMHVPGTPEVEESPQTLMCAPLTSRGQTIGVLSVYRERTQGLFTQVDLDFFVALVREAAAAIENARLFEAEQRRAEQFQVIGEVGRRMISLLPVDDLLWEISRLIKETLGYYLVGIALIEGDELVFKAGAGAVWQSPTFQPPRVQIGRQGITGWVASSGEPLLVNDLSQESRYYGLPEAGEMQSELAVPLKTKERVIGVLHVQSDRLNAFDESDLAVLQSLAHQAAIAIENARLFTEVRRQQQFSESLVENTPVAIIAVAPDDRVMSWNPAAERLFGYTQAEALGRKLMDLITSPDMREEFRQFSGDALSTGRVHAVTQRRRKDGSLVDVEMSGVAVGTGDEEMGLVAIYHDITELKEAARANEESQRRLADIIDFLPDATVVIDREGRVIAWNRAMEEMTGVKAQDMLGKGDYEYTLPLYGHRRPMLIDLVLLPDEEMETRYAHIERKGATLFGEALVPLGRARPAYLYGSASALRDSRGEIVGAIETIRDISDRKQVEKELRQAKAAAEAATQAKSAFLATMSHEIRTPMNAVIGMTSLLLDTPLTPEQQEFATTIRSSGDALLAVINDILDFSKIEAERIELERQPFDVRECVESALGLVAGQAAAKSLELSCWIDPQVPAGIVGDETRLRQIVLNLLSNALKFTEEGEVVVNVAVDEAPLEVEGMGAVCLHFSVRDTGLGIPSDRMDRLFQSFSQVDSSTTRKYGGTGLGLAISRRLVDLMGGHMWAESAGIHGQGSTFHFTIEAQPASIPSRAELEGDVPDLRGRKVLIVDDNATSRRILTLQTEAWGMVPRATGSPAEALEWVRGGEVFDVAILDRRMPEMDGVMLAAEIHRRPDTQSLPLMMVSSLGQGEAEETKDLAAFLVKPVRASQLYNGLVGILAGRAAAAARPAAAPPQFDAELGKRQPLRILLAEDNVVNQKLALRLLERLGYRADLAANGVEAVRAVERQPYDVVFMDVQMPEMDGLEATRQICARWGKGQRPRIVAMTANALAEDREACLSAGMDDYLAKPIRVEELVAALRRSEVTS